MFKKIIVSLVALFVVLNIATVNVTSAEELLPFDIYSSAEKTNNSAFFGKTRTYEAGTSFYLIGSSNSSAYATQYLKESSEFTGIVVDSNDSIFDLKDFCKSDVYGKYVKTINNDLVFQFTLESSLEVGQQVFLFKGEDIDPFDEDDFDNYFLANFTCTPSDSHIYFANEWGEQYYNEMFIYIKEDSNGSLFYYDSQTKEDVELSPEIVGNSRYVVKDYGEGPVYVICGEKTGDFTINYKGSSFIIHCTFPSSGFYSASEKDDDNYLGHDLKPSNESSTVYLITNDLDGFDFSIFNMEWSEEEEAPIHVKFSDYTSTFVKSDEDGYSIFKINFPNGIENYTQLQFVKGNVDVFDEEEFFTCLNFFDDTQDDPQDKGDLVISQGESYDIQSCRAYRLVLEEDFITDIDIKRNGKSVVGSEEITNNSYFEVDLDNCSISGRIESYGTYDLIVKTNGGIIYTCTINVENDHLFENGFVLVDDKLYRFGYVSQSREDDDNLIFISGGNVDLSFSDPTYNLKIAVGEYEDGEVKGCASQEIFEKVLDNFSFEVFDKNGNNAEDLITCNLLNATLLDKNANTFNTKEIVSLFGEIDEENLDEYELTLVANTLIDNKIFKTKFTFWFVKVNRFEFNVADLQLGSQTVIERLNDILEDKESLNDFFKDKKERDISDDDIITFLLPGNQELEGTLVFDCKEQNDKYEINIQPDTGFTTIKGSVVNNGGLHSIYGIKFVSTISGADNANDIGLYSKDNDIPEVNTCEFVGYSKAIDSEGTGKISGIYNNTFIENNIGIYMNSTNSHGGSASNNNVFINNKYSIYLNNVPVNDEPLNFSMDKNYFFSEDPDSYDYYVSDNFEGVYYFTKNFYGKVYSTSLEDSLKNDNVRNIRINSADRNTIVTNPCIRYPEDSDNKLGIDPLGITKFLYNTNYSFHLNDLNNISIGLANDDGQKDLGKLVFGGND